MTAEADELNILRHDPEDVGDFTNRYGICVVEIPKREGAHPSVHTGIFDQLEEAIEWGKEQIEEKFRLYSNLEESKKPERVYFIPAKLHKHASKPGRIVWVRFTPDES